ncbi:hypothetical protein HDU97_006816 [Phlyctochytrium planicorne]|nr:hypothetical protein HDU97_006816 [Phlyctochytrium planicorne]
MAKGKRNMKPKGKGKRPRKQRDESEEEVEDDRDDTPHNYDLDIDTVHPDDDEEIDEDEAFDSSDEEKYGSFFSESAASKKGPKKDKDVSSDDDLLDEGPSFTAKKGKKTAPVEEEEDEDEQDEDDEEDEEEEDEEDGADMINISDMLDMPDEDEPPAKPAKAKGKDVVETLLPKSISDDFDDVELDDDLMDDEDEDDVEDDDEEAEDDTYALDGPNSTSLMDFVESLDSKSRDRSKKRKITEVQEAFPPSEFNIPNRSEDRSTKRKLNMADLVGGIGDDTGFGALKKQFEEFSKDDGANAKQRVLTRGQAEATPLPARLQQKLEREAAFGTAKKEVSKWAYTVKMNREAEQLRFPLNEAPVDLLTSSSLVGSFKSETNMEKEIAQVLKDQKLAEKSQREQEDLEMNELTKEEVAERRAELAKMRALLFYAEQKQKKIAKIKSKVYRKILKKEKEKKGAQDLAELDPELAKEMMLKQETDRIKERMTLKHKSTGKWAKNQLGRRDGGAGSRQAIMDQLNRHQELTKKVAGLDSGDEEDEDDDEDLDEDDDEASGARERAIRQLEQMEEDGDDDDSAPKKGVFAMKFMQRDRENQKKAVRAQLEATKEDIRSGNLSFNEGDEEEEYEGMELSDDEELQAERAEKRKKAAEDSRKPIVQGGGGRMSFQKSDAAGAASMLGSLDDDRDEEFVAQPTSHSVRVSGPVSVMFTPKKSILKLDPLFQEESFTVEDEEDKSFTAQIKRAEFSKSSNTADSNTTTTTSTATADSKKLSSQKKRVSFDSLPDLENAEDADEEPVKPAFKFSQTHEKNLDVDIKIGSGSKISDIPESNPWLDVQEGKGGRGYKKAGGGKGETRDRVATAQKKMQSMDDVELNLDFKQLEKTVPKALQKPVTPSVVGKGSKASADAGKTNGKKAKEASVVMLQEFSDEDSDDDFGIKPSVSNLTKSDVMQMAFANDDVFAEFEEEKQGIIDQDKPKDEDVTLPGWGAWSGNGIAPKKNVVVKKAKAHEGVDASKRKDAKLKNVIISEKPNRKAAKFMATTVPHGFQTRDQYEESIRLPMGKEWNANMSHSKLVAPKVVVKMGQIIQPLNKVLLAPNSEKGKNGGKSAPRYKDKK